MPLPSITHGLGKRLIDLRSNLLAAVGQDGDRTLRQVTDDVPRSIPQPVTVTTSTPDAETLPDGRTRALFTVLVKDAEGARVPDVFVEVAATDAVRTETLTNTTDVAGRAQFGLNDPQGDVSWQITSVGAGALEVETTATEAG